MRLMQQKLEILHIDSAISYSDALALQENRLADIIDNRLGEALFICEHSPIYTCGSSADMAADYIGGNNIPVIQTGRGGKITYHGPGQIVVYPIMDLRTRERDLRKYVEDLQVWIINTLAELGLEAYTTDDVGVWVRTPTGDAKIAAIGVRVRKWVAFHGIALNHQPDMSHYNGIVPCGIKGKGVTSLKALGIDISKTDLENLLLKHFKQTFFK
jgi:lipoyl(octanoyl) transferase